MRETKQDAIPPENIPGSNPTIRKFFTTALSGDGFCSIALRIPENTSVSRVPRIFTRGKGVEQK